MITRVKTYPPHDCPQGISIDVVHSYYLSKAHDPDAADPIGAKHWKGAGFQVIASCLLCHEHLQALRFLATYEMGELTVNPDHYAKESA